MSPSRTVSVINVDIGRQTQYFRTTVFDDPVECVALQFSDSNVTPLSHMG